MIHLTYSGFYAGLPICGEKRNEKDTYQHFGTTSTIEHIISELCPDCRAIWDEVENEIKTENAQKDMLSACGIR